MAGTNKKDDRARPHRRTVVRVATVIATGALVMAAAACSSSAPKAARPTTPKTHATTSTTAKLSESDIDDAIKATILPGDEKAAATVPLPAGFLACTAAKLPAAARVAIAKGNNASDEPDDETIWVLQAGVACNRAYVRSASAADLSTGDDALPGITPSQATCAAGAAVDAVVAMSPEAVGSRAGDSSPVGQAQEKALDTCYPVTSFVDRELRLIAPEISQAQLDCVHRGLGPVTWLSVVAKSDDFQNKMESAGAVCLAN
jgi:hypothetical protein